MVLFHNLHMSHFGHRERSQSTCGLRDSAEATLERVRKVLFPPTLFMSVCPHSLHVAYQRAGQMERLRRFEYSRYVFCYLTSRMKISRSEHTLSAIPTANLQDIIVHTNRSHLGRRPAPKEAQAEGDRLILLQRQRSLRGLREVMNFATRNCVVMMLAYSEG
jgi:hypothetical protein